MHKMLNEYKHFLWLILLLGTIYSVEAQSNITTVQVELLSGEAYTDVLTSVGQPIGKSDLQMNSSSLSGDEYLISPTFPAGFTGEITGVVEYYVLSNPLIPTPHYKIYNFTISNSMLDVNDDVVVLDSNDPVTIDVLGNDSTTGSSLELVSINQTKLGTSTISSSGSMIDYTPVPDEEDIILYTVKDDMGSSKQGIVYLVREDLTYDANDTLEFVMTNRSKETILLPNQSFALQGASSNLSISAVSGLAYNVVAPNDYTGDEYIVFVDGAGASVTYHITVLEHLDDLGIVKNDVFHTAKNMDIVFDVRENDLASGFIIHSTDSELVKLSNGVYSYTPPTNFEGLKKFNYTTYFGIGSETATIDIVVGNYEPTYTKIYDFDAVSGEPFTIDYSLPIDGYSFEILNAPLNGVVETYLDIDSYNIDCTNGSGRVIVSYTPDISYTGYDEFDIQYCVEDVCRNYKLKFEVVSPNGNECVCVEDCVWAGDANHDGFVNVTDLLSIGRHMGTIGPLRNTSSLPIYTGEQGDEWGAQQPNGVNVKHVDSNNDGVVTAEDVDAIINNYGVVNSLVPTVNYLQRNYPVYLDAYPEVVDSGDVLTIDIHIGNETNLVKNLHGLSFNLNVPPGLIDSSSLNTEFYDDWFTRNSPSLSLAVQPVDGMIDAGFTRTSGKAVSGYGLVATVSFIVEEDLDGFREDGLEYVFRDIILSNLVMEDGAGGVYNVPGAHTNVRQNFVVTSTDNNELHQLTITPNPTSDFLNIKGDHISSTSTIMITNSTGQVANVQPSSVNDGLARVNVSDLQSGVYFVSISNNGITTTDKFIKVE